MLTQKDITRLETLFATKEELQDVRNDMITRFDAVMFELKAIREDLAASTYRQIIHSDTLENHEERLTTLETPLASRQKSPV